MALTSCDNTAVSSAFVAAGARGDGSPSVYFIRYCVQRLGVAGYLANLRARRNARLYGEAEFSLLAARAYLWAGLPRRAFSLLKSHPLADSRRGILLAQAEAQLAATPSVCTLNMIVKNEEASLGRALASVDDCVDEIVVCDTGSSDTTMDIAQSYGAVVVRDAWADNFSRARNVALAASSGAWIFWMDADDVLDASSKHAMKNLIRSNRPHAAFLCVDNVHHGSVGTQFMQIRLFPRLAGAAFERRVHEQIGPSLQRLGVEHREYPDIRVVHCGYDDAEVHKKKAARNRPLIEEELRNAPDSPALLLSLGDCLSVLEETEKALDIYHSIIAHPSARRTHPDMYVQAAFNIAFLHRGAGRISEARSWLARTISLDPSRSEAFYVLGQMALEQGQADEAFEHFLSCCRIKPPVRRTATDALKIRIDSLLRVAQFMFSRDMHEECGAILAAALEAYPNVVDFHALYGKVLLCAGNLPEAARHFTTALTLARNNSPDAARGLAVVFMLVKDSARSRDFIAIADRCDIPVAVAA